MADRKRRLSFTKRKMSEISCAFAFQYFLKDAKGRDLLDAVRAVHAGQRPLPPDIAACLAERIPYPDLSPRELEILRLIARGHSNREIRKPSGH